LPPPWVRPGAAPELPRPGAPLVALGLGVGAVLVEARGEGVRGVVVVGAADVGAVEADSPAPEDVRALADVPAEEAGADGAESSAVGPVCRSLPSDPSDDAPEKEKPAITAARDTAPIAPATTAARGVRRERRRWEGGASSRGASSTTGGSCVVSS
jgi:hypothetical protein